MDPQHDPMAALERLASGPNLLALAERIRLSMAPPPQFTHDFARMLDHELQADQWRRHTALGRPRLVGLHGDASGNVEIQIEAILVFYASNVLHVVADKIAPKYPRAGLLDLYDEMPEIGAAFGALAEERIQWDVQIQSSHMWQEDAAAFSKVQELGPLEIHTFFVKVEPLRSASNKVIQFKLRGHLQMRKMA